MSEQPSPKQRRNQRGSVEDRWRKRAKDESGNTVDVPSAVAGKVRRWRARYVDNAGREHSRTFDRKVDAQKWLDTQLASLLRGDHVAPKDAKLTVGEWCDKWLAGYGTRRKSTVRQAEVHIKIIKAHFDAVPLSAVRPSDVRAWTRGAQGRGARRLVRLRALLPAVAALHRRGPRRDRRPQPVLAAYVARDGQATAVCRDHQADLGAVRRGARRSAAGHPARRPRGTTARGGCRPARRGCRLRDRAGLARRCSGWTSR